jgi:malate/lactate dehydrogenase
VESIIRNENSILPVSCYLQNYHGVSEVCLSVPAVINRGGVQRIINLPLSGEEEAAFVRSAAAVNEINRSIGL